MLVDIRQINCFSYKSDAFVLDAFVLDCPETSGLPEFEWTINGVTL